jgi:hypothetical protein
MYRSDEEMAVRDEKCREISDAFARAGVGVRYNRMPQMGCSSIVGWETCGPTSQRRTIVTIDDAGDCRIYLSHVCVVAAGNEGVDMLSGMAAPMLCMLPAAVQNLGAEVLRRLRSEDHGPTAGHDGAPSWAGGVGHARQDESSRS